LFMGMSSEAFDRLKEAHFLRDVGLPASGHLNPVLWFGTFWLVGMIFGFVGIGWLIKRLERSRGDRGCTRPAGLTFIHPAGVLPLRGLAAKGLFALTGRTWLAMGPVLGVLAARDLGSGPHTIWLAPQITDPR